MSSDDQQGVDRTATAGPARRTLDVLAPFKNGRPGERRLRRGAYLLPSLFTLGNMFCGYLCVLYAMRRDITTAAPFIGIAIVLDMLDGRIARLTGATSEFGKEFDSLADVISFGVAPAILAFVWGLEPLGRLGWAAGFIFVTAAALRLARFNIQSGSTDKRFFVGMPSPGAAAVVASTVYFYPEGFTDYRSAMIAFVVTVVPALLMVSTVRFRSFKNLDLRARRPSKVLLLLALVFAVVQLEPRVVLVALAYIFLLSAFVEFALSRFRRRPGTPPPPTVPLQGS
jgi:CDP-diacylglycerol---serine O-phosphatidyltransferase